MVVSCTMENFRRYDEHISWHLERVKYWYPNEDVVVHSQMVNACQSGNTQLLQSILQRHQGLDSCLGWYVWMATMYRQYDILKTLLKFGANPNGTPDSGRIPVYEAVCNTDVTSLRILIQNGCDININVGNGSNVLITAAGYGDADVIQLLIDSGCYVNKPDNFGMTALHKAINTRKKKSVQLLLENGANPNIPNDMGLCALQLVLITWDLRRSSLEDIDIVKELIRNGSNVNAPYYQLQYDGLHTKSITSLQMAIQCEEPILVEMLLYANASMTGMKSCLESHGVILNRKNYQVLQYLKDCYHNPRSLKSQITVAREVGAEDSAH